MQISWQSILKLLSSCLDVPAIVNVHFTCERQNPGNSRTQFPRQTLGFIYEEQRNRSRVRVELFIKKHNGEPRGDAGGKVRRS